MTDTYIRRPDVTVNSSLHSALAEAVQLAREANTCPIRVYPVDNDTPVSLDTDNKIMIYADSRRQTPLIELRFYFSIDDDPRLALLENSPCYSAAADGIMCADIDSAAYLVSEVMQKVWDFDDSGLKYAFVTAAS